MKKVDTLQLRNLIKSFLHVHICVGVYVHVKAKSYR